MSKQIAKDPTFQDKLDALHIKKYNGPSFLLDEWYDKYANKADRKDKLDALNMTQFEGTDEMLDLLYDQFVLDKKRGKPIESKIESDILPKVELEIPPKVESEILPKDDEKVFEPIISKNIDKTTDQYKLLLGFVNKILVNMGKEKVGNLTDFKNIDRLDIVKEINEQALHKDIIKLKKVFPNLKHIYKIDSPNNVINCIRSMCKDVGLSTDRTRKSISNNGYHRTAYIYTIK